MAKSVPPVYPRRSSAATTTTGGSDGDFWSMRYISPIPWEREDVSSYDGHLFEAAVRDKSRHPEVATVPKR